MSTKFAIKPFDDLTSVDLYHILRARSQVFVVEQHCAYQDIDGIDFDCLHLIAHKDEALIGYCRIIPPNTVAENIASEKTVPENTVLNTITSEKTVLPSPPTETSVTHKVASKPSIAPCRIGRVLVLPEHRGAGLARKMMTQAITYCHDNYKKRPIAISAQTYLISFYQSLGFKSVGEPYLEDGIEHIDMVLQDVKKSKLRALTTPNYLTIMLLIVSILVIIGIIYLMV